MYMYIQAQFLTPFCVCMCCHVKGHWSVRVVRLSPPPLLIGTDNINSYPFRISAYTMLQVHGDVEWAKKCISDGANVNYQDKVSYDVHVYHIEGSEMYFTCTTHIHFTS